KACARRVRSPTDKGNGEICEGPWPDSATARTRMIFALRSGRMTRGEKARHHQPAVGLPQVPFNVFRFAPLPSKPSITYARRRDSGQDHLAVVVGFSPAAADLRLFSQAKERIHPMRSVPEMSRAGSSFAAFRRALPIGLITVGLLLASLA